MRQVRTGDWVWAAAAATQAGSGSAGAGAELVQVLSVSTEMATGLYNPFTLVGGWADAHGKVQLARALLYVGYKF